MRQYTINLIAAGVCLACGIAYTAADRPPPTITTLVVLGIANLVFVLAR